jgi:hypothetical protein
MMCQAAPFDRIILTVGAHDISPTWRAQPAPGPAGPRPTVEGHGPPGSILTLGRRG